MLSIPDSITISRVVMSLILLAVTPFSIVFYVLYTLCGLSDIADGYTARMTGKVSKCGEILDSLADIVFFVVMLIIIIPFITWQIWILSWVIVIAVIRVLSLSVRYIKSRMFTPLHSIMNKGSGVLLFAFLYLFRMMDPNILIFIICCFITVAAIDELIRIILTKPEKRKSQI